METILIVIVVLAWLFAIVTRKSWGIEGKPTQDGQLKSFLLSKKLLLVPVIIFAIAWLLHHVLVFGSIPLWLTVVYGFMGAYAITSVFISCFYRPFHQHLTVKLNYNASVIIPLYNEDEEGIRLTLNSLLHQTHLPKEVVVVDDGSVVDYRALIEEMYVAFCEVGIDFHYMKQKNSGKREAHTAAIHALKTFDEQTIIVTVDSDSSLDKYAIEEGLKPFSNQNIASVAGLVIARNAQTNLLARITDVLFVNQQLVDRAVMSILGSVPVNSGGLAFYRHEVIESALKYGYTNEQFLGKKVVFSDDSYLTLFALLTGKAVQQQTAVVFADMPTNFSHHVRQQIRWGRGSFIRGMWRIKYLPVSSYAFWRQFVGWVIFFLATGMVGVIVFLLVAQKVPWLPIAIIMLSFSYLMNLQYLTVQRNDMSFISLMFNYILSPCVSVWGIVVIRLIKIYAMLTCGKLKWGTRETVEEIDR